MTELERTETRATPSLSTALESQRPPTAAAHSSIGPSSTIGDYVIVDHLGAGGMGEVYIAHRIGSTELVALKTLSRASSTHLYRFKREFRALADVRHPNLVQLHELMVTTDGRAFFTMELLRGAPFVSWVRSGVDDGALPDLERLVPALRQLVDGVEALHRRDFVHRDLKPSNVLVTDAGRVVILDFGLVSELDEPDHGVTRTGQLLGTPIYMAPEQARGEVAGIAADFYAVGIMLYECLTGTRPYEGLLFEILAQKQESLDIDATLVHVPSVLRNACIGLLDRNPESRALGRELLANLDELAVQGARRDQHSRTLRSRPQSFVGRVEELGVLGGAYDRMYDGRAPVVVHLRGPSGQGKSELLRQFRRSLGSKNCLVLHGRCRERETLPYKGIDAVIDALSAHLRRMSTHMRQALRPRSVAAIVQAFPVLVDLWPIELARLSLRELRTACWAGLSELLRGLAELQPLVVQIDDFQWSDLDSVELLEELLSAPTPLPMLLILVLRDDTGATEALRALAHSQTLGGAVIEIQLESLSQAEALVLANALATDRPERDELWAESVALRSGGNPFFVHQLVQDLSNIESGVVELDAFVARRVDRLAAPVRRLLEVVAVAGGPLDVELAQELCPEAGLADIEFARAEGLVVLGTPAGHPPRARLETTHDRVREVVMQQLAPDRRTALHTALGQRLLARCGGDARGEALFRIVDQLDAGLGELDDLDDGRRLELAKLTSQAAETAMDKSSYELAESYFKRAHQLLQPWFEHGPSGGSEHGLCVATLFGWARVTSDAQLSDRLYDELLSWSLGAEDLERILVERLFALFFAGRNQIVVELGPKLLRELGVRVPRRMTRFRAYWEFWRGARAIARLGSRRLVDLPTTQELKIRTIMGILPPIYLCSANISNREWATCLTGWHARFIARHGRHEGFMYGLGLLSVGLGLAGAPVRSQAIWRKMLAYEQDGGLLTNRDRAALSTLILLFEPREQSIRSFVAQIETQHRLCSELAQHGAAAQYVSLGSTLHFEAGTPLREVPPFIEDLRARTRFENYPDNKRTTNAILSLIRQLIDGPLDNPVPDLDEFRAALFRNSMITRCVWFAVMFRNYGAAGDLIRDISPDHERGLLGYWSTAIYATVASIVLAEQAGSARGHDRRRLVRTIRAHRATLERWSHHYRAENWTPMRTLVDAELAILGGGSSEAFVAYETASDAAEANHMIWLAALASDRLAIQSQRSGHTLYATTALSRARALYERWGAMAVVRALDGAQLSC